MKANATEVTRRQELIYELKIEQVMVREVISVSPDATIAELKELLRSRRVSGVPVIEGTRLVGMISIENLIRALEQGKTQALVRDFMTRNVQAVKSADSVVSAVNMFAHFGYGRFPVVDDNDNLVGILTKGDIVRGLLRQMEVEWHAEEIQTYRASHIFEDIESDDTSLFLRYNVASGDFVHGGAASSKIKKALERLGADPRVIRRVAVATYEAETNIIIHSHGGEITAEINPHLIRIVAVDTGPGIDDVEKAMTAGYSTAPDWIREMGFGAGMGLANIKACADEMKLESVPGEFTRLELTFSLE